jgi:hypothetical protein
MFRCHFARTLALLLAAAASALAQDRSSTTDTRDQRAAIELLSRRSDVPVDALTRLAAAALDGPARCANTVPDAPRAHVDRPIPEGWRIIEGDIIVPPAEEGYAATYDTMLWSGGIVPYTFDTNMSFDDIVAVVIAMLDWEEVSNLDFRPRVDTDLIWVHVRNSTDDDDPACSSPVGKPGFPGAQVINYTDGCLTSFSVHHELAHTLGYWHEQTRPDRDTYVDILWDNISGGGDCNTGSEKACNFVLQEGAGKYGDYDFDSVMHYSQSSFPASPGLVTIDVKAPWEQWQSLIGQRDHLSAWDALVMSFMYPESGWRFDDPAGPANSSGTFLLPWNKSFSSAVAATPSGGTLVILSGEEFDWEGVITKQITLLAPVGGVVVR